MKKLFELFLAFAKLGVVNFGGGYALLPLLERDIVEKKGWATTDEIQDYYAIGQCTPGIIAVNVSTFIGYKIHGIIGGIVATLGFISPSIVIILAIASILSNYSDNPYVLDAFSGISVCVVVLILKAVITLSKKSIIDKFTLLIFIAVALTMLFFNISAIILVVLSGLMGIVINNLIIRGVKQ